MAAADVSGPQLTWANIVATVGVMMVVFGAGWTLFQTQFSALERRLTEIQNTGNVRDNALRDELQRRESELKGLLRDVQDDLRRGREEFVGHPEFRQFQSAGDDRWRTQAEINGRALDAYVTTKAFQQWQEANELRLKHIEDMQSRVGDDLHRMFAPPAK